MRTCEDYQEMISAAVDGELAQEDLAELHAHMDSCPDCKLVYDAFQGISGAMADDLAEPPAELLTGVMLKVNAKNSAAKKKRRVPIGRIAAMAACLAVIVLGVSQLDLFRGAPAAVDSSAARYAVANDTNSAPAPAAEPAMDDACAPQDYPADAEAAGSDQNEFLAEPGEENDRFSGKEDAALSVYDDGEAPSTALTTEAVDESRLAGMAAVTLYTADAPDTPLGSVTDETALAELKALLAAAEVYPGTGAPKAETYYQLDITDASGSISTLRLWTLGDALWYTDGDNHFLASGSLENLLALLS